MSVKQHHRSILVYLVAAALIGYAGSYFFGDGGLAAWGRSRISLSDLQDQINDLQAQVDALRQEKVDRTEFAASQRRQDDRLNDHDARLAHVEACLDELKDPGGVDDTCDGIDDDQDGQIDEDFVSEQTSCGAGECRASGETLCVDGTIIDTCRPGTPSEEICDGRDNDCDGQVDEGFNLGEPCTVGQGQCAREGRIVCDERGGRTCSATPGNPSPEVCDGQDNDCDGLVDEDLNCGCPTGETDCSGVCVDTNTDPRHCGACGVSCAEGEVCVSGVCQSSG